MKTRWLIPASIIVVGMMLLYLPGCGGGGGGGGAAVGTVAITVCFPAAVGTADLPNATNSVRFSVLDPATLAEKVRSVLVRRPAAGLTVTATITGIEPGDALVRAEAFATAGGTGVVIADAQAPVTVIANDTVRVDMVADRLPVRTVINGPTTIERGEATTYTATAYDADDRVVLGVTFKDWASDSAAALALEAAGGATALAAGAANVSVTAEFRADTWTPAVAVTVFERAPATVRVTPPNMALFVTEKQPVMAEALDATDTIIPYAAVTWHSADEAIAQVSPPDPPPGPVSAEDGVSGAVITGIGDGLTDVIATAVTAAGQATGACHVTVHGRITVQGQVLLLNDDGSTQPQAGATVTLTSATVASRTYNAITGADGRFSMLEVIVPDTYEVTAEAPGASSGELKTADIPAGDPAVPHELDAIYVTASPPDQPPL